MVPKAAGSSVEGRTGTSAAIASFFASILSPIAAIASGDGPTHATPASITAWANAAFSARKP